MRLTLDSKWKEVLLVLAALPLAACSLGQSPQTGSRSSPAGDGGRGGGPCTNVAICTLIPQSQVNTTLGVTAMFTSPETPTNMGGMTSDECSYNAGATAPGMHVELLRQCNPEFEAVTYETARRAYLAPGGTRTDLTGIGDKAFYETVPYSGTTLPPKVRLVALKGNVIVFLSDSQVPAAQDAMVKQGLTSFANTLLAAK
ncbi:MAG TPA: hypothetical protein VHE60_08755 [Pyrinomonadaceae bacterium]|nr:hypothetical protein [Pyrinomonadaceae bacterium]